MKLMSRKSKNILDNGSLLVLNPKILDKVKPDLRGFRRYRLTTIASTTDGYVFLGFSRDGVYLVSYSLEIDVPDIDSLLGPQHKYKFQWWLFRGSQRLLLVKEVDLFSDEQVDSSLFIAYCQWPLPSNAVVVYGRSQVDATSYITVCQMPRTPGNGTEVLDQDDRQPDITLSLQYNVLDKVTRFSPNTSMMDPGYLILNTSDSVVSLSQHPLTQSCSLCKADISDSVNVTSQTMYYSLQQIEDIDDEQSSNFYNYTIKDSQGQRLHHCKRDSQGCCLVVHEVLVDIEQYVTGLSDLSRQNEPMLSLLDYNTSLLQTCTETHRCMVGVTANLRTPTSSQDQLQTKVYQLNVIFQLHLDTGLLTLLSQSQKLLESVSLKNRGDLSAALHKPRNNCHEIQQNQKSWLSSHTIPHDVRCLVWTLNNAPVIAGRSLRFLRDPTGIIYITL